MHVFPPGDLEGFRDRHRGQRCFVLGNGPSLRHYDLTLLIPEFTMVVNWFPRHPQARQLEATYGFAVDLDFCSSDSFHREWHPLVLQQLPRTSLFLPEDIRSHVTTSGLFNDRSVFYLTYRPWESVRDQDRMRVDITGRLYVSLSSVVVQACLPVAFFMGFRDVYLLGCDGTVGQTPVNRRHFYDGEGHQAYPRWAEFEATYEQEWGTFQQREWATIANRELSIARRTFAAAGRRLRFLRPPDLESLLRPSTNEPADQQTHGAR